MAYKLRDVDIKYFIAVEKISKNNFFYTVLDMSITVSNRISYLNLSNENAKVKFSYS